MIDQILFLILYTASLLPFASMADIAFRTVILTSIVAHTLDEVEQKTLARIARYESGFSERVAKCETNGGDAKEGVSYGIYQTKPMDEQDARYICSTVDDQTFLALKYVRRAVAQCPENKGAAKLNVYTSGRCDWGYEASKLRWGGER